jgi:hypothetical protein
MSQVNFLPVFLARKGQIVTVETVRPLKVRKGMPEILKHSTFQARVGVTYDNIGVVQEKRESGELPAENQGLPWGQWEIFPYVIAHKGEKYLRCTMLRNGFHRAPVFTVNGAEITRDEAQRMALASEFSDRDDGPDVFNIKLSSVRAVR